MMTGQKQTPAVESRSLHDVRVSGRGGHRTWSRAGGSVVPCPLRGEVNRSSGALAVGRRFGSRDLTGRGAHWTLVHALMAHATLAEHAGAAMAIKGRLRHQVGLLLVGEAIEEGRQRRLHGLERGEMRGFEG